MNKRKQKIYHIRVENSFTVSNFFLVLFGVLLDIILPGLLKILHLPLYLDNIGSAFVGIMGGWIPGMMSALVSGFVNYLGQSSGPVFSILGVVMAGLAAKISRRGMLRKRSGFVCLWGMMMLVGGGIGSVMGWYIYGQTVGVNRAHDFVFWLCERGWSGFSAQFLGDMMMETIDKGLVVLGIALLIKLFPTGWRDKLPFSYIYKCTDQELEHEYQKMVRPFLGNSVYDKMIYITNLAVTFLGVVVAVYAIYTYVVNVFFVNRNVYLLYSYVINLFSLELMVILVAVSIVSWYVYHTLERPIRGIVTQSVSFANTNPTDWLKSQAWKNRYRISTEDELQVLYETICQTETYVANTVKEVMEKTRIEKENIELQKTLEMSLLEKQVRSELEEVLVSVGIGTWRIEKHEGEKIRMVADDQMKRLLGIGEKNLTPEETYEAWVRGIEPSSIPLVNAYKDEMIANGNAEVTYQWRDPKKGVRYVRCGGHGYDVHGKGYILKGYHSDVTSQVKKEKEQKLQTEAFVAVAEEFDYVFFADLDANSIRILYISSKTRKNVVEVLKESVEYDDMFAVYASHFVREGEEAEYLENSNRQRVSKIMQKQNSYSFQYRTEVTNTKWKHFEVMYVKTQNQPDENTVIIAVRCVDELMKQNQKLEEALEEAKQANVAKTMFLSRMSHDIRTPLNGIIGLMEMGERHPDDVELLRENRRKGKVAAGHLLSLINDVLELTKLDDKNVKLVKEVFNARMLVDEVITITEMRAVEEGITLIHHNCPDVKSNLYVNGSPLYIRQVFLNIFDNAIKYNCAGGQVEFAATLTYKDPEHVIFRCSISDTGVGMNAEFVEKIFEPFSQEHQDARSVYHGTGLGMSIVKALLEKMDGSIEVESEENVGSTFTIEIPFEVVLSQEEKEKRGRGKKKDIVGVNILLVEDNELNMEISEFLLEDSGAVVTKAWDGKQAVEMFEENPSGTFDIILMDVMMPVMDGMEATREIRKIKREDAASIPIIAMTANAFAEDVQAVKEAGMNGHIAKPIREDIVVETIAKFI